MFKQICTKGLEKFVPFYLALVNFPFYDMHFIYLISSTTTKVTFCGFYYRLPMCKTLHTIISHLPHPYYLGTSPCFQIFSCIHECVLDTISI